MLTGIPYQPFPEIPLGPLNLQTFGLFVALGILTGGWLAVRRNSRLGIPPETTERIAVILVVAGLVGARVLWVFTSLDQIDSPLDVIAVWNGGLQFSGGFVMAVLLAPLLTRHMSAAQRWHLLDSVAIGLAAGLMLGRVGCYAVGEHLGGPTSFPLGITYQGGQTVEGPLTVGVTYWSTPVLEFVYVGLILAAMFWVDRRGGAGAGTLAGIFCVGYAVTRFASDFLREYDRTVLGLTGAQYMMFAMLALGVWFLVTARGRTTPAEYRRSLGSDDTAGEAPDGAVHEAPEEAVHEAPDESVHEPADGSVAEAPDAAPSRPGDAVP